MKSFAMKICAQHPGKTMLFSAGQAGYIIRSKSGQLLAIDLYLSDCVERIEGHMGFKRLLPKILHPDELAFEAVIATHPHLDHFDMDAVPEMLAGGDTELFASVECEQLVHRLQLDDAETVKRIHYVKPGDEERAGDFRIRFISCDHGEGAPDAVGVIVCVDDKVIVETGDTCLHLDWEREYLSEGAIDVLIAPINGAFGNMDETACAELAEALRPGITIPCHYGMFASHGGDPGKFYEIMKTRFPENKVYLMTMGEGLVL